MRAAIFEKAGKVEIKDVPKPTPKREEALIKNLISLILNLSTINR